MFYYIRSYIGFKDVSIATQYIYILNFPIFPLDTDSSLACSARKIRKANNIICWQVRIDTQILIRRTLAPGSRPSVTSVRQLLKLGGTIAEINGIGCVYCGNWAYLQCSRK